MTVRYDHAGALERAERKRRREHRTRLGRWLNRRADWRAVRQLERAAGRPAPAWSSSWDRRGGARG